VLSRATALESGKQAVKTAIAGVASLGITNLFHLPEGYWAAISALIVMQSNLGATLNASRTRLAGTAVGATVGGVFVALLGNSITGFAIAVAIAFVVCDLLGLAESQRLATVTVAIIMLVSRTNAAWIIALHRFEEVALGILVALVVSLTLWPNHARRSIRQGLAGVLVKLAEMYSALMRAYRRGEAGSLEPLKSGLSAALRKNNDLLQYALQESFGPMKERESLALLVNQVERIFATVETLEFAIPAGQPDAYSQNFEPGLEQLEAAVLRALDALSKRIGGQSAAGWPDVAAVVSALDDQAEDARKAGVTQQYPLDEVLRFYFLLLSSRNLARELELASAAINS
jgi:uncharacterized membrane protein YgaE (UPF0421/DUF939 family)